MKRGITTANAIVLAIVVISSVFVASLLTSFSGVEDISGNIVTMVRSTIGGFCGTKTSTYKFFSGTRTRTYTYTCPGGSSCVNSICVATTPAVATPTRCFDSDGGKDFYVSGKAYSPAVNKYLEDRCANVTVEGYPGAASGIISDRCLASDKGCGVIEAYCGTDKAAIYWPKLCPGGCVNGACIPTVAETPIAVAETPTPTSIMGGLTTVQKQDVLNMLNNCEVSNVAGVVVDGNWACQNIKKVCLTSIIGVRVGATDDIIIRFVPCNSGLAGEVIKDKTLGIAEKSVLCC